MPGINNPMWNSGLTGADSEYNLITFWNRKFIDKKTQDEWWKEKGLFIPTSTNLKEIVLKHPVTKEGVLYFLSHHLNKLTSSSPGIRPIKKFGKFNISLSSETPPEEDISELIHQITHGIYRIAEKDLSQEHEALLNEESSRFLFIQSNKDFCEYHFIHLHMFDIS